MPCRCRIGFLNALKIEYLKLKLICFEQKLIYKNPYDEAMRYIYNANETLKLAGREGKFYVHEKYIHSACGTAYIGMLKGSNVFVPD